MKCLAPLCSLASQVVSASPSTGSVEMEKKTWSERKRRGGRKIIHSKVWDLSHVWDSNDDRVGRPSWVADVFLFLLLSPRQFSMALAHCRFLSRALASPRIAWPLNLFQTPQLLRWYIILQLSSFLLVFLTLLCSSPLLSRFCECVCTRVERRF